MEEEQRVEGVLPSEEQLSVFLSYQLLSQRLPADLRQILRIDRTLAVNYQSESSCSINQSIKTLIDVDKPQRDKVHMLT